LGYTSKFLCIPAIRAGGIVFCLSVLVRPSVRPLTPISRDAVSPYLVEGFQ